MTGTLRGAGSPAGPVLIMAGGTGGHIFPALAVAHVLRQRGVAVVWLGVPGSMESRLVPKMDFRSSGCASLVSAARAPWLGPWHRCAS